MSNFRTRLFLIFTVVASVVGGLGHYTMESFQSYSSLNRELRQSYQLVQTAEDLYKKPFNGKTFKSLQKVRGTLNPEHRQTAFSDILQAYSSNNNSLLQKRTRFFERNEIEYRSYVTSKINYLEKQVHYYGLITLGISLLSLLVTYLFIRGNILNPIRGLHRKMVDFLNNKYSYQFSVPPPNEIGNLEATFNSLAQRVLSNLEELKALDKAKSDFLSIASHELRTPLTSIKGSLSLLRAGVAGNVDEKCKNLMTIALSETDRLIRLINDLLDLAKIEARKFPLNKEWCPANRFVTDTFSGLQGLADTAEVSLVGIDIPNVEVNIDKDRIQQVLTNLVSNAIKYSPKQGEINVSVTEDENNNLVVKVSDQGEGIAPEDQELIFQQFRQATGPKNPLVKGTGLGLAIAKALVEEHGGVIGLYSTPGEGSTFYFILPEWRSILEEKQQAVAEVSMEMAA